MPCRDRFLLSAVRHECAARKCRRPAHGTRDASAELIADLTRSVQPTSDIDRDQEHFRAGYGLGFASGRQIGYNHGRLDSDNEWSAMFGTWVETCKSPRFAQIEAARNAPIKLCGSPKCNPVPKCSACLHVMAVLRRGGDYLGQVAS
jgi:hypothetical protein